MKIKLFKFNLTSIQLDILKSIIIYYNKWSRDKDEFTLENQAMFKTIKMVNDELKLHQEYFYASPEEMYHLAGILERASDFMDIDIEEYEGSPCEEITKLFDKVNLTYYKNEIPYFEKFSDKNQYKRLNEINKLKKLNEIKQKMQIVYC